MTLEPTFEEKALLDLADQYRQSFYNSDAQSFLKILGNDSVTTQLFERIYGVLLKFEGIVPIESLSDEEKRKLTDSALEVAVDRKRERIIRIAKAIHVLNTILEN